MRRIPFTPAIWTCLLALLSGRSAMSFEPAVAPQPRAKYVRLERDPAGKLLALQTAVAHFTSSDTSRPDPVTVDLVAAVHVGDKAYYDALNELFTKYDVVLYELVAPEGTRVPKGAKPGGHPVAMLQNGMKDMLALEHQLQCIDYTKKNMVHADMSPEDFSKSMSDRGESVVGMFFRMMGQGIAQQTKLEAQGKSSQVDLLTALFEKDRAGAMKRLFAEQFESLEDLMQALEGPQGSTIITERNKVALKKLASEISGGKCKIAIFYGAGHLADMEKHLTADFHLRRDGETWLNAWRLDKAAPAPQPVDHGSDASAK
ncbi:MAG TPA: hypothetical protein VHV08_17575 [Pirellulales bacterium]|nr:hypothetical protein [Pirellulales bacterium]